MNPHVVISQHNGYDLSRIWFNWVFENPHKVNPTHTALYLWLVELNNRCGWAEAFSAPSAYCMSAIGMKSYSSYRKVFDELAGFGFVTVLTKSTNQHTACVVSLPKTKQNSNSSLDVAFNLLYRNSLEQPSKQPSEQQSKQQSKQLIHKQTVNSKQETLVTAESADASSANELDGLTADQIKSWVAFSGWVRDNTPKILRFKKRLTPKQYFAIRGYGRELFRNESVAKAHLLDVLLAMENHKPLLTKYESANLTIRNWLKNRLDSKAKLPESSTNSELDKLVKLLHAAKSN